MEKNRYKSFDLELPPIFGQTHVGDPSPVLLVGSDSYLVVQISTHPILNALTYIFDVFLYVHVISPSIALVVTVNRSCPPQKGEAFV